MSYRRRVRYAEMAYTRNPHPARGPDVLSLDMLRYYIHKIFTDPVYSVANVVGAKTAFIRHCSLTYDYFRLLFIKNKQQFMSRAVQRRVSRQVLMVIRGQLHYETNVPKWTQAIAVYDPQGTPPVGAPPITRELQWRLQWHRSGPSFRRI